jgi:NAD(P)-dependent dehydrogenase (short-subunit alcohol dehydrogenase family)
VAREITNATGNEALGLACHVVRWSDCDHLVAGVLDRFGSIDVLVNNAGMSPLYHSLDTVSEELFDKVIDVNLKGAFRLTALCGAAMAERSGGSIINISSIAAVRPSPAEVPYAAAKAALNNLTVATARSLGPSVRSTPSRRGRSSPTSARRATWTASSGRRPPRSLPAGVVTPTRSSAPRCTSPARHRATRTARC